MSGIVKLFHRINGIVTTLVLLLMPLQAAFAMEVSGSLILPAGVSPQGDLNVWVRFQDVNGNETTRQKLITFPSGSAAGTAKTFSLLNVPDSDAASWQLSYDCSSFGTGPVPCENLVGSGYYSSSAGGGVVYKQVDTSLLAGGQPHTGLNMTLLTGQSISGTLSLPSGVAPAGGIELDIWAASLSPPGLLYGASNLLVEEDASAVVYQLTVPADANQSWQLRYSCVNPPACEPYLQDGYYSSSAPNTTSDTLSQAEALPGGSSAHTGIDLRLLTGYLISGKFTSPVAVPAGGMSITMLAQDDVQGTVSSVHSLAQGATEVVYSLMIPTAGSAQWGVRYECNTSVTPLACADILTQGFYQSLQIPGTTVAGASGAELLQGGQGYSDINLIGLTGMKISGELVLTQGVAPESGLTFLVSAINISGSGGQSGISVTMPAGGATVSYSLNVDPDSGKSWRVQYNCNEVATLACSGVTDKAYFDAVSSNTVEDENVAAGLAGGQNHENIDLDVVSQLSDKSSSCFVVKAGGGAAVFCL